MADQTSRRQALKIMGSVATTTFLAGCSSPNNSDSSGDDGSTDGDGDGSNNDESSDDGSSDDGSSDDSSSDDGSSDDGSSDDSSSDDGSSDSVDPAAWEDVSTIRLQSDGLSWAGAEPEMIAGEENPTLVLYEGNEYEFIYENADGGFHNLELRNADNGVVEDYSTEVMGEKDETRSFTAEATSDIVKYVCQPHSSSMVGEIRIE